MRTNLSVEERIYFATQQLDTVSVLLHNAGAGGEVGIDKQHLIGVSNWLLAIKDVLAPISDGPASLLNWEPTDPKTDRCRASLN